VTPDRPSTQDGATATEDLTAAGGRGGVRVLVFANTMTSFGASVTEFALPLIALSVLDASAATVAMLYAVTLAAQAFASLPVGVWVDRTDQKRSMILGLVAGGLVVLAVPLLAATDRLSVGRLVLVAVGAGVAATVVQTSAQALVPAIADGRTLVSANAGLSFGRSLGTMVGPGAGGLLVGWLGAATALVVDGVSQLVAAALLLRLRVPEVARAVADRPRLAVRRGIRAVAGDAVLRRIVLGTTVVNIGGGLIGSLWFTYAYRELGLGPAAIGVASTIGNVGLLAGSLMATRVIARLGLGRATMLASTVAVVAFALIPLATVAAPLVLLASYEFVFSVSMAVFGVSVSTLRHERTEPGLQGRVFSVVQLGPMFGAPVGAVLAAVLVALPLGVLAAIGIGIGIGIAGLAAYWLPGWLGATRHVRPLAG
jgi:MFS family permease